MRRTRGTRVTSTPSASMVPATGVSPNGQPAQGLGDGRIANDTSSMVQVYLQGAPEIQSDLNHGTVTLSNVIDFGSGVNQPTIGIDRGDCILASPPLADVQPNATAPGGKLIITEYSGIDAFGTGKVSWKADSSARAYGVRTYSRISQIPWDYLDCEGDRRWGTASMS